MLSAFIVFSPSVVLGRRAVTFCGVFVMFSRLVMSFLGHAVLLCLCQWISTFPRHGRSGTCCLTMKFPIYLNRRILMRRSLLVSAFIVTVSSAALAEGKAISVQSSDMLSTNVVGLDVYDGQKNDIGKIQDIVWGDGKTVKGYVLSVGGFLGMGTHYVAVDPSVVNVHYDTNNKKWMAETTATKDDLKAAPEFKYEGQWNASKS
jgi:hypothetical protein